jgi:transglutaminase-like putative cysteine protease
MKVQAKTPESKTAVDALVTYEATLRSRELKELEPGMKAPKVAELSAADRKKALAATATIDFDAPTFKKWLADEKLVREKDESEIDFARRTFLALRQYLTFTVAGKLEHKASMVALTKKSDELGMNNLYVAVLRANKIPARALVGRWADAAQKGRYYQWQTMSEFYADGVGWVPTDVSSNARRDGALPGLACFGKDIGHFIAFHVDTDMEAAVPMNGQKKFETTQEPHFFVNGAGAGDGIQFRSDWKIEKVP